MDDFDSRLRDRLFLTRLSRHLAHEKVRRESEVTQRLHDEFHQVLAQARRLKRRAVWLVRTGRPLPRQVVR